MAYSLKRNKDRLNIIITQYICRLYIDVTLTIIISENSLSEVNALSSVKLEY